MLSFPVGDLPPPPPFSLFSGDPPFVAASIAMILLGLAAGAMMLWMVTRITRKPHPQADRPSSAKKQG